MSFQRFENRVLAAQVVLLLVVGVPGVAATHPTHPPGMTEGPSGADMAVTARIERESGNETHATIIVENRGATVPQGVVLEATITEVPGGWTIEDPECVLVGEDLTCEYPNWPPGFVAFPVILRADTSCHGASLATTVTATNDEVADENSASAILLDVCGNEADISVTTSWIDDGTKWGFEATVTNHGPHPSMNTTLVFRLSPDRIANESIAWTVEPATLQCDFVSDPGSDFECPLGEIPAGETRTGRITSEGPLCGSPVSAHTFAGTDNDLNFDNNVASAEFDPPPCPHEADIVLTEEAWRDADTIGWFRITVENVGPNTSRSPYLQAYMVNYHTDDWMIAEAPPECYIALGHDLECPLDDISVGDRVTVTVKEARPSCALLWVGSTLDSENEADMESNFAGAELPECSPPPEEAPASSDPPTTTTPIPYFPSLASAAVGILTAVGGAFLLLRRKQP